MQAGRQDPCLLAGAPASARPFNEKAMEQLDPMRSSPPSSPQEPPALPALIDLSEVVGSSIE